jgi:hypothetical protein
MIFLNNTHRNPQFEAEEYISENLRAWNVQKLENLETYLTVLTQHFLGAPNVVDSSVVLNYPVEIYELARSVSIIIGAAAKKMHVSESEVLQYASDFWSDVFFNINMKSE